MNRLQAFNRLSLVVTVLTFIVVVLGAFVRLSDAGLGCPDWPGCYGELTVPADEQSIESARESWNDTPLARGDEAWTEKAWKEMVHRYVAGFLGLIVLALAVMAIRNRRDPEQPVVLPLFLVGLIVFQALLGMWTVTLLVKPAIVLAHLLGGLSTLALLWLQYLKTRPRPSVRSFKVAPGLRRLGVAAGLVLLLQIALGGWVSTNYAALACPDFPACHGSYWPEMDFADGFTLWRGLGQNYEFGVLENDARTAIHYSHRFTAILVLLVVGAFSFGLFRAGGDGRPLGAVLGSLLLTQLTLGTLVVIYGLPLWLATAHNAGAALLLLAMVSALWSLYRKRP